MKKFVLSMVFAGIGLGLFAQSVDKAKDLLKANKLMDAKAEIDKVLAIDKNQKNQEAWFIKTKIYTAIAASKDLGPQVPDAYAQAFDALKKYMDLDDKKIYLLLIQDQYKPINDIYQGYFQAGANSFNTGKFSDALANFKGAIDALHFMVEKGWIKSTMDTTSTFYAGISAERAGKTDEAAGFYKTIVDSGITKIGSNDMVEIYKWVVDYYNKKEDKDNTMKYLAKGEEKFPKDLFWPETELDLLRKGTDKNALWAKYDEITKQFPDSSLFFFDYGLELYQYASDTSSGKRPDNADELTKKAQDELAKCLQLNPNYAQASLVMGQISYNAGVDLQMEAKAVKGNKPDDVKKRADLRAAMNKKFDEAIPYFEKVDQDLGDKGKLKMQDKSTLRDAYDLLVNIYEAKGVKDKSAAYTDKYNNVEKLH